MSEFFEKNYQALAKHAANQPMLERLMQVETAKDIEVFETAAGDLSIVYKNMPLHSTEGAINESQQLVQEYCKPSEKGVHILFGLGLGYTLAEMAAATKGQSKSVILVFEPFLPLLRFTMENVDLSPYCEGRTILFSDDPLEFYRLIQSYYMWSHSSPPDFIVHDAYLHLAKEDITQILQRIPKLIEGQQQSIRVGLTLGQEWINHYVKILPYWPKTRPFDVLEGRFFGKSAVVVSAGPSLDKTINELKQYQDRAVIIAVGRAIRPLMNAGIKPDFALFLDYEGAQPQLSNLPGSTEDIYFIAGPYAEEHIFTVPHAGVFMCHLDKFPLALWSDHILGIESKPVDVMGTVSYLGLQTALILGCTDIIMTGQDLAFHDNRQYADGALNSDQRIEDGHLILAESPSYAGTKIPLIETVGQNGETLYTTQDYKMYKNNLEQFAELCNHYKKDRKLVNASPGGVQLNGFENASIAGILEKRQAFEKHNVLAKLLEQPLLYQHGQYKKLRKGLTDVLETSNHLSGYIETSLKMLEEFHSQTDWEHLGPRFMEVQEKVKKALASDHLIAMVFNGPAYEFNQAINKNVQNWDERLQNIKATKRFMESCRDILKGDFKEALQGSIGKLDAIIEQEAVTI